MEIIEIFKLLQEQIHTTIVATNDENGNPVTCAVDIRQEHCLYCGNCYEVCPEKAIEKARII